MKLNCSWNSAGSHLTSHPSIWCVLQESGPNSQTVSQQSKQTVWETKKHPRQVKFTPALWPGRVQWYPSTHFSASVILYYWRRNETNLYVKAGLHYFILKKHLIGVKSHLKCSALLAAAANLVFKRWLKEHFERKQISTTILDEALRVQLLHIVLFRTSKLTRVKLNLKTGCKCFSSIKYIWNSHLVLCMLKIMHHLSEKKKERGELCQRCTLPRMVF